MDKLAKEKIRKQPVNFGMLDDAMHAILDGVQGMFDESKVDLNKKFEKINTNIGFVHSDLKRQISDLKHDTPSIKEFNELKKRMDLHHPVI